MGCRTSNSRDLNTNYQSSQGDRILWQLSIVAIQIISGHTLASGLTAHILDPGVFGILGAFIVPVGSSFSDRCLPPFAQCIFRTFDDAVFPIVLVLFCVIVVLRPSIKPPTIGKQTPPPPTLISLSQLLFTILPMGQFSFNPCSPSHCGLVWSVGQ